MPQSNLSPPARAFLLAASLVGLAASPRHGAHHHHHHRPPPAKAAAKAPAPASAAPAPLTGRTELVWLGHAAFQVRSPAGALLLIDPWLDNSQAPRRYTPPEALDAIVLTHGHPHHLGSTAQIAAKTGARVIAVSELLAQLDVPATQKVAANVGGEVVVRDVTIALTEALHGNVVDIGGEDHYAGAAVGLVLSIARGPVIYHAGDTEVFAGMAEIARRYHPQVALLPIGGRFTMGPAGAARAAALLGVATVVPMHYGSLPALTGTPAELRTRLGKTAQLKVLVAGDVFTL